MTDPHILQKAARIKLAIFDVDGVLTDGRLYYGDSGGEYKAFFSRDGHGLKLLQAHHIAIAVISGRMSKAVEQRMADLGVVHVYLGIQDKVAAFEDLRAQLALSPEQVAYVGDDWIDLPVMSRVGLAVAVADADPLVKRCAHWATSSSGGRGAVREVCELLLAAQGKLAAEETRYLRDNGLRDSP